MRLSAAGKGERPVFWNEGGDFQTTPIFAYELLRPGNVIEGPAVVEGEYTTLVVPPSMRFSMDDRSLGILEKK